MTEICKRLLSFGFWIHLYSILWQCLGTGPTCDLPHTQCFFCQVAPPPPPAPCFSIFDRPLPQWFFFHLDPLPPWFFNRWAFHPPHVYSNGIALICLRYYSNTTGLEDGVPKFLGKFGIKYPQTYFESNIWKTTMWETVEANNNKYSL